MNFYSTWCVFISTSWLDLVHQQEPQTEWINTSILQSSKGCQGILRNDSSPENDVPWKEQIKNWLCYSVFSNKHNGLIFGYGNFEVFW